MPAQLLLGSNIPGQDRDFPGIGTRAATRITDILFEWLTFLDDGACAGNASDFRRTGGPRLALGLGVTAFRNDVFAVVTLINAVAGEILPKVATGGFARVG